MARGGKGPTSLGQGSIVRETDKAMLVELDSGDEVWVPLSVIHDDSELYQGCEEDEGELVVEEWFADKEGLG